MRLDSKKHLEDVRRAGESIVRFSHDRTLQDYADDTLLRSAIERQFEIIGEALNRLSKFDPVTADRISDRSQIIAFRNILIHAYDAVDDHVVWEAATKKLPGLLDEVRALLNEPTETQ